MFELLFIEKNDEKMRASLLTAVGSLWFEFKPLDVIDDVFGPMGARHVCKMMWRWVKYEKRNSFDIDWELEMNLLNVDACQAQDMWRMPLRSEVTTRSHAATTDTKAREAIPITPPSESAFLRRQKAKSGSRLHVSQGKDVAVVVFETSWRKVSNYKAVQSDG
ncbi:hypothetical protein Tco_0828539 [Tanacetum coccineum]